MDWEDLRHLAAVGRQGSLSGAARALGVDHATVGRRVAALEARTGLRLLERRGRGTALTEAGERVAALAFDMEDRVLAVERLAQAERQPAAVEVVVSAPPSLAMFMLAESLVDLRRALPSITVTLRGEASLVSLTRREADLTLRLQAPSEPTSVARKVGEMAYGLYAAVDYPHGPDGDWSLVSYDAEMSRLTQQEWLRAFAAGRPVSFRSNDMGVLQPAARAGLGVALLPCFMADGDPGLRRWSGVAPPNRGLWLAVHEDLRRSAAVRAVGDHLAAVIHRERGRLLGV
ncbi:transcriptional regulator [Caulobacter sp. AP07]|uniref:LysR family transcriptional regulator n=1 Tax=Caulobacter sp. AP07 TaxID=1144304 RepID=UPI000271FCF1|nr:LysR family transcriptional regulator [Caulobacter sp. AP07]EJL25507.1 transcriptional regulator [Caulobacter sp. AP07]